MVKKKEETIDEIVEEVTAPNEIIVGEAVVFTHQTRPDVITPSNGVWDNAEQEAFAKVINTWAYTNPKKWAVRKDALVQQLKDLGNK